MTRVLPALAALALGGVVVATRRSTVLHVATPGGAGLTPTGRLRRGHSPVCGQRARRWTTTTPDGRALCARCARRTPDSPAAVPDRATAAELLAETIRTAPDLATLHDAIMALVSSGPGVMTTPVPGPNGYPVALTHLVGVARARLTAPRRWAS